MSFHPIPTQMIKGVTYKDKAGNTFRINLDGSHSVNGVTYPMKEGRAKQREIQVGALIQA